MKRIFGSLCLVGLLMGGSLHYAYANSGDNFIAPIGTPVIDGVQSAGEWDSAVQIPVFTTLKSTLFIMNDGTNLYLALKVPEAAIVNNDIFEIRFDNGHDGVLTVGDDELRLDGASTFIDTHFAAGNFGVLDAQQDGAGSAGNAGGFNFFEIAHPLKSGDVNDIAIAPGGTLGFCVRYFDNGVSFSPELTFPEDCVLLFNTQSKYADLTPSPFFSTSTTVAVGPCELSGDALTEFNSQCLVNGAGLLLSRDSEGGISGCECPGVTSFVCKDGTPDPCVGDPSQSLTDVDAATWMIMGSDGPGSHQFFLYCPAGTSADAECKKYFFPHFP